MVVFGIFGDFFERGIAGARELLSAYRYVPTLSYLRDCNSNHLCIHSFRAFCVLKGVGCSLFVKP